MTLGSVLTSELTCSTREASLDGVTDSKERFRCGVLEVNVVAWGW